VCFDSANESANLAAAAETISQCFECELVYRAKTSYQNDFEGKAKNGETDHFKGVHKFSFLRINLPDATSAPVRGEPHRQDHHGGRIHFRQWHTCTGMSGTND
jgi:hypothetical protein